MTSWRRGTHVFHYAKGEGVIIKEWGSWLECPICGTETILEGPQRCTQCRQEIEWTRKVNGRHVYEVRFGRDRFTYSVHQSRLKLHAPRPKKLSPARSLPEMHDTGGSQSHRANDG